MNNTAKAPIKSNIDSLDGLRGFACLLVVLSHLGNLQLFFNIKGSAVLAVMTFFSLSGFLMAYLYGEGRVTGIRMGKYLIRRVFRIYPLFAVFIIGSYFTYKWGWGVYPITAHELVKHLLLDGKVSVFWTIPVEMKFYFVFPVLALVISLLKTPLQKFICCLLIFLVFDIVNYNNGKISVWSHIEFFLGGMTAAYLYHTVKDKIYPYQSAINVLFVFCLIGNIIALPFVFNALFGFHHGLWRDAEYFAPLISLTLIACALSSGFLNWIFANPISRFLGLVSYGLYLVHLPTIKFVRDGLDMPVFVEFFCCVALSLFFAWLLHLLIENPFRRIGSKFAQRFQER